MNLLTSVVLMGTSGYVLFVVFHILCRMDASTPRFLAWRVVLTGSLGTYGFLEGVIAFCSATSPEWYQLVILAAIALIFALSPRIETAPRNERTRLPVAR